MPHTPMLAGSECLTWVGQTFTGASGMTADGGCASPGSLLLLIEMRAVYCRCPKGRQYTDIQMEISELGL